MLSTCFHSCHRSSQSTTIKITSPATCTSTFSKSLLNQGLSLAEAKDIKEKCGKCSATLQSNTVLVRCSNKGFHQKCSTGPKASFRDNNWNCNKCAKILQQSNSANITQLPTSTNTIPSQQLSAQSKDKLAIMQQNADGICPKLLELCNRLINSDINIVAIQGSKLCKADKTPLIEGYATIHKDQNNILCCSLLFFVHNDLIFKKLHSLERAVMQVLSIHVHTMKIIIDRSAPADLHQQKAADLL